MSSLGTWQAWLHWRAALVRRYRTQGRTCPLATLMSELGRQDPASQQVVSSLLLRWRTDLATGIRALQATGHAQTVDADTHAGALLAAIQGGVSILLATGSSAELDAVLDLSLAPLGPGQRAAEAGEDHSRSHRRRLIRPAPPPDSPGSLQTPPHTGGRDVGHRDVVESAR